MYEVVVPFGDTEADGLFDDCPLCQELKRQIEAGEVEEVPIQLDRDPDGQTN